MFSNFSHFSLGLNGQTGQTLGRTAVLTSFTWISFRSISSPTRRHQQDLLLWCLPVVLGMALEQLQLMTWKLQGETVVPGAGAPWATFQYRIWTKTYTQNLTNSCVNQFWMGWWRGLNLPEATHSYPHNCQKSVNLWFSSFVNLQSRGYIYAAQNFMNHESPQVVYIQSPTQGHQPAVFPPRSSWKDCWDHSSSQVSIGTWAKQLKTLHHRAVSEVAGFQLLQPQSESSSTKMDQFPMTPVLRFFRSAPKPKFNTMEFSRLRSRIHPSTISTSPPPGPIPSQGHGTWCTHPRRPVSHPPVGWLKLSPLGCVPDDGKLENPRTLLFSIGPPPKKKNICRKGGYVVLEKPIGEKKQSVKLT